MNERHRCDLFLTRREQQPCVVFRRQVGSLLAEVAFLPVAATEPIQLRVVAEEQWYRFYLVDGHSTHCLGRAETRHLSTEMAGGFTGVYLGVYATGGGKLGSWGHFDYIDYEDLTAARKSPRRSLMDHRASSGTKPKTACTHKKPCLAECPS
jgi:xylan 1,4-beta-xylosidase